MYIVFVHECAAVFWNWYMPSWKDHLCFLPYVVFSHMGSLKSAMLKSSITSHQEIGTNPGFFFFSFSLKLHWLSLLEHSQFGIWGGAYFRIKNYFNSSMLWKLLCSPYYLLPAREKTKLSDIADRNLKRYSYFGKQPSTLNVNTHTQCLT